MKRWRLTIGIKDYFLTEEEKNFYMNCVKKGDQYAVFTDKMLSTKFQALVNETVVEESTNMEVGKWKCASGRWHSQGFECTCQNKYVFDEKTNKYQLITNKLNSD